MLGYVADELPDSLSDLFITAAEAVANRLGQAGYR